MALRQACALSLAFLAAASALSQGSAPGVYGMFTGRYHCGGQWTDLQFKMSPGVGLLGIPDPDEGVTAAITVHFRRSITSFDAATYLLKGQYDEKTGRFHLEPQRWSSPHPAAFEMIWIEGTFDAGSGKMAVRMLSGTCDAVELVPPGVQLPPLPSQSAPRAAALVPNPARPEQRLTPTNVTNYLDPAAYSPDFEYLVTASFDLPGTVHDGEPIDEAIDHMKKDKFACGGSQHVIWDATGTKGTAPDRVGITERYVIECVGDCKGVLYRPFVGANVTHFGLSEPLPTMQIKSVWAGGTTFRWNFSRTTNTQPPPEIYVHRWIPQVGFGPLDPGPAEVARRIASAPPCRAPTAATKTKQDDLVER